MTIASAGEVLFDLIGKNEYLGGAPFNFAAHSARLGHRVFFVSAVGQDPRGGRILERAAQFGVDTRFLEQTSEQPTGIVSVIMDGKSHRFEIHRPAAYDCVRFDADAAAELSRARPGWVCFNTLFSMNPNSHGVLSRVLDTIPDATRFYDINLRPESWRPDLIRELALWADVVKLNEDEVSVVAPLLNVPAAPLEQFARRAAAEFAWEAVSITRGERGCALLHGAEYAEVDGERVDVVDTVGAGDAFAAAFVHGLDSGWALREIGQFANRLGALVASRAGAVPD